MTTTQLAFLIPAGLVVVVVLEFWIAYRAGRRPLAIYDQGSAISIVAALTIMSQGAHGLSLWLAGTVGLLTGLCACLLVHGQRHHVVGRSEAFLMVFYVASFVLYAASTVVGTLVVRWALDYALATAFFTSASRA